MKVTFFLHKIYCFIFYFHLLISLSLNNKVFTSYVLGIGISYPVHNLTECMAISIPIMKSLAAEMVLNSGMANCGMYLTKHDECQAFETTGGRNFVPTNSTRWQPDQFA